MAIEVDQIQPKTLTNASEQPAIPLSPGKDTEELVSGIQEGLNGLNEMFSITPGITNQDKMKLQRIMTEYKELIMENLGASPGEEIKKPKTGLDQVPPEIAGAVNAIRAMF